MNSKFPLSPGNVIGVSKDKEKCILFLRFHIVVLMFAMPSLLSRRLVISMNLYSPEIGRIVTLKTVVL